jgi:biotin transport system substrate-specific component
MQYLTEDGNIWTKDLISSTSLSRVLGIGLFLLLTVMGAFVRIPLPFTPVPITLQTLSVLLSGLFLKKFDGSISQGIYILFGLFGLPIFAESAGGASIILGPTGGYLIAFVIAPFAVNMAYGHLPLRNIHARAIAALALGTLIIHALGVINLAFFLKTDPLNAVILGSAPFILGDAAKVLLGAELCIYYKKKVTRS